ncbi:MAG: hypothetical protein Q8O64_16340 [Sideroxyarcus sp.]|nr:hypothetical protein [Sideroxyarcus sp.]
MRALRADSTPAAAVWLALAVLLAYGNSLTGMFQFDDYNVIVRESTVHGWSQWFADLGHGIRPLLKFSYMLNWVTGAGAPAFHLTNLLIHLANVWLVYLLAQRLLQRWSPALPSSLALWVALLFALHPAHSEAVSYISGRSASLMTLCYLGGLLAYIEGRTQSNTLKIQVLTPMLFILALGSKETAVTFPLALWLWEWCSATRWRETLKATAASWLVLLLAAGMFLSSENYLSQMARSAELNSLQGNLATQLTGFVWLLRQWALPLWLNIDPDLPLLAKLTDALLPLAFSLVCLTLIFLCRHKRPWISFALAWAMLHLIPLYLILPRIDVANERQLYLAAWPLLIALLIEAARKVNLRTLRYGLAVVLLALTSFTVLRNQDYASEIALWQDTVVKSPLKARVHNNLGYAYLLAQRDDEARREFITSLQLDPQLDRARHNLHRVNDEIEKAGGTLRP